MTAIVDLSSKPWLEGETWVIEFEANDSKGKAIDLTGATISFLVADGSGDVVVNLVTPCDEIHVTSTEDGTGVIKVTPDLPPTRYKYEFWVVTASGEETAQARGEILVAKSMRNH